MLRQILRMSGFDELPELSVHRRIGGDIRQQRIKSKQSLWHTQSKIEGPVVMPNDLVMRIRFRGIPSTEPTKDAFFRIALEKTRDRVHRRFLNGRMLLCSAAD